MNWVEIVSAVLGLGCVFLAGRNSIYNFWVGYAYNVFLFILFLSQGLYGAMALQVVAFAINIYGHYRWTHPKQGEVSSADGKSLKVSKLTSNQWSGIVLITLLSASVIGALFQDKTSDPAPWLDAYILIATLLAQWLSAQKVWECWWVWLAVNAANIILYVKAGLTFMPFVSALYLANGVWSLISWYKLYKKDE